MFDAFWYKSDSKLTGVVLSLWAFKLNIANYVYISIF